MKCLSIQVQPEIDSSYNVNELVELSRSLDRFPEVDRDEGDRKYVNLNYFSENIPVLWQELKVGLYENRSIGTWLKKVSIAICEGEEGWDDYVLLYHYDQSKTLDDLPDH
ncbi:MAG: hypothetical protein OQJ89_08960 [Kangiellaceae bacterium]|nr:hypothetical protein [Kangiellaceae bacterium]MCW8998485.1 hypothetical protein [Kangiellaceae bacterium]MCW9017080.1 hypothetical protein [Kangiellaceae bacterium]